MTQTTNITHPLLLETKIKATRPRCSCKGGGFDIVLGVIKKVITNHTGHWYYLSTGITVQDKWVVEIL
jgi:hypothetical protein